MLRLILNRYATVQLETGGVTLTQIRSCLCLSEELANECAAFKTNSLKHKSIIPVGLILQLIHNVLLLKGK